MKRYTIVLLFVYALRGMEEQAPPYNPHDGMVEIRRWQDARPYIGNFVAYRPAYVNEYFGALGERDDQYLLDPNRPIRYWYIEAENTNVSSHLESNYKISRLFKSRSPDPKCSFDLCDRGLLSSGFLRMRVANLEEMRAVLAAIRAGQAKFDTAGIDKVLASRLGEPVNPSRWSLSSLLEYLGNNYEHFIHGL